MTNFSSGGIQPGSVALADFNGDGKLDIVVSNFMSYTIVVFLNKGDGTFGDPIVTPVQITPEGLGAFAVGDFNEDGKLDLVVDAMAGSDTALVLLGNGDGTFSQLPPIPNSFGFLQSIAVDLNGDGHLDLVNACNGNIEMYLGNGDGTFQSPTYLPYGPAFPGAFLGITMGDFNGDKKLDIVGLDLGGEPLTSGSLLFYAGNGDGTFQTPTTAPPLPFTNPSSIASADFNGDSKLDMLMGFPNTAVIASGNGDGTFQFGSASLQTVYVTQNFVDNGTMVVKTADFDLDGKPDAVVGDSYNGILTLVLNNGIGQGSPPTGAKYQFTLVSGISDIAVGDLNGDGLPDMVISNGKTNQMTVILSQKQ